MANELRNKRVAALVENGFEQSELLEPKKALEAAGARVDVVSPQNGRVKGWKHTDWGQEVGVDRALDEVKADEYDALLLPGGVISPDRLRMNTKAVGFVKAFADAGKPIAAICHGPWTLIEAGVVQGRKMTSGRLCRTTCATPARTGSIRKSSPTAGLVTSRKPDDIPAFNRKMIEEFAEGPHRDGETRQLTGAGKS